MKASLLVSSSAALALTACSITIAPAPEVASNDCGGQGGQCSVAARAAQEQVAKADFGAEVRDYLLAHPEVIAEAQQALRTRQVAERQAQTKKALIDLHDAVFADPADPVIGNPSGDVTIVEWFDNECPYCKSLHPVIEQLIASDPGVRVVAKEFPILGPGSDAAARYALAAAKQSKYAPFHVALMADKTPEHQLDEAKILAVAASVGLDIVRLKTDVASPDIAQRIANNRAIAARLSITGTPGLIVGDQIQPGAMTLEALKKAVADARANKARS